MSEKIIRKRIDLRGPPYRLSPEANARLDAITDEDIERAAATDPDNPILTALDMKRFRRVSPAKHVRQLLGMTQQAFAQAYGIPIGTLRDWEQHRTEPDQAARSYLKVIAARPKDVRGAVAE